jgi:hypothetical protein
MRIGDAIGDRPGVNIAIIDVPAILPVFGSAAGKLGHPGIEAPDPAQIEMETGRSDKKTAPKGMKLRDGSRSSASQRLQQRAGDAIPTIGFGG